MICHQKEWYLAVGISLCVFVAFVLLQKTGLVNLIGGGELGYGAVFLIGIIASLSTCMAVVGGMVLSLGDFCEGRGRICSTTLFPYRASRRVLFLGGIIGLIGTAFTLSTTMTFILNVVIGLVMIILGLKLLGVEALRGVRISFPTIFRTHVEGIRTVNSTFTPLLVGIATFFMPCGFTQSMQLYTLSTGICLGWTHDAHLCTWYTSGACARERRFCITRRKSICRNFYKTAGLIVLAFATMNLINSLVVIGLISPVFRF